MKYDQLIQLYFERSNALQWYWTLYVVIIGGLLAFSSVRKERDVVTTALVSVLFLFFAYENLGAIHDTTLQRFAALHSIKETSAFEFRLDSVGMEMATGLEATLLPPDYSDVRNTHVAGDLLTVAALWTMELRRYKSRHRPGGS